MTLAKVCSGLVGLGLAMGMTAAQQPPAADPKPRQKTPSPKPPTDELEAAIAAASTSHPDVRMAQAKLQMAQAELDQAKLLVAQRLATARAKVLSAQAQVENETQLYQHVSRLNAQRGVPKSELQAHEHKLAQAKAALAAAEAEWQAARGQPPGQKAAAMKDAPLTALALASLMASNTQEHQHQQALQSYLGLVNRAAAPTPGSVADKLHELVGKRVTLDMKEPVVFGKALAEFAKQAGLGDLTVRTPEWVGDRFLSNPPRVGPLVGEHTVAGWFQLILDDFTQSLVISSPIPEHRGKYEVYVRDYGLLITKTDLAPPGAPTLAEFARQAQAQKDAAPKSEPKK